MPPLDTDKQKARNNLGSNRYITEGRAVAKERLKGHPFPDMFLKGKTDEDYAKLGRESIKEKQGGFLKSIASATLGGLVDVGETFLRAGRALPGGEEAGIGQLGPGAAIEGLKKVRERIPLIAERPEAGSLYAGYRSFITSLGARAPGAALGATATAWIPIPGAPIIGAGIGALLSGGPTFGLAEYDATMEQGLTSEKYQKGEITAGQIQDTAVKVGLHEFGWEAASDLLSLGIARTGFFLTNPAKETLKQSIKQTLKSSGKEVAKRMAAISAVETGSELLTAGFQTEELRKLGLTDQTFMDGVATAFGPAFVASLLFGGLAEGGIKLKRVGLRKTLENPKDSPETRASAVNEVAIHLGEIDQGIADTWRKNAMQAVENNEAISTNESVIDSTSKPYEKSFNEKSVSANLISMIDKGMAEGELNGQPFTPETALSTIQEAYEDNALTLENLETIDEKHPTIGLKDFIWEQDKDRIEKEITTEATKPAEELPVEEPALPEEEVLADAEAVIKDEVPVEEVIAVRAEGVKIEPKIEPEPKEVKDVGKEKGRLARAERKGEEPGRPVLEGEGKAPVKTGTFLGKAKAEEAASKEPKEKPIQFDTELENKAFELSKTGTGVSKIEIASVATPSGKTKLRIVQLTNEGDTIGWGSYSDSRQALIDRIKESLYQKKKGKDSYIDQAKQSLSPEYRKEKDAYKEEQVESKKEYNKEQTIKTKIKRIEKRLAHLRNTGEQTPERKQKIEAEEQKFVNASEELNKLIEATKPEVKAKEPAKKEVEKAAPKEEFAGIPLETITVKTKILRETTGKTVTIEQNAKEALADIDQDLENYYELLACL